MIGNKFTYFLNAVHYCMWRSEIKQQNFVNKTVTPIISLLVKFFTTKEYQEKFFTRQAIGQKEFDVWRVNKQTGLHIAEANHWFGYLYSCYPCFWGFILATFPTKCMENSGIFSMIVIALPVILAYIPAYKAVFSKDRYLGYFKQFEKEDEQWQKKWSRITTAFCIGAIILFFAGPFSMLGLLILLD